MEVDCWDGPNGEPIVYHGHTFTSKILFKDVISTVEKYAFEVILGIQRNQEYALALVQVGLMSNFSIHHCILGIGIPTDFDN